MATGIVRNVACGLVLDASQDEVMLQPYMGLQAQLWYLESTGNGRFVFVNSGNGNVMDVQGGEEGGSVLTYARHGGDNQQWYINPDNTIVSATGGGNLALDVSGGILIAGASIIAYPRHGGENQQFTFQHM